MIKLYSTHCPKCKVLEMKLKQKGMDFEVIDNLDKVLEIGKEVGIMSTPILQVEDQYFNFEQAIKYISSKRD